MRSLLPLVVVLLLSHPPAVGIGFQSSATSACTAPALDPGRSAILRVPIDVSNNHVFVAVCDAGRPLHFLLDTGAPRSFMELGIARALGAELTDRFEVRGAGAGGTTGGSIPTRRLTLAGTAVSVEVKSAIDLKALTPREGRPIEGILGYDFINRFVVAIDYHGKELRLHDSRTFRYQGPGIPVPLVFADNKPHVDASLRLADGAIVPGRFIVDVGSSLALSLVKGFVERHRLVERTGATVQRPGGGGVGTPALATIGRVAALRIGAVEIAAPVTHMFGEAAGVFSGNPHWIGNIGSDVLRRFTVYFDYDRKRMILEPNADRDVPFEADMSGANFLDTQDLGRLLVDYVVPGSAAAEAGLQRGDVVLEVEGQPVRQGTLLELRARVRKDGESITLTVLREGASRPLTFRTRRLV